MESREVKFGLTRGLRLGRYQIVRRLGNGHVAEAYLASEVPTGALRVLKIYDMFDYSQRIRNLSTFAHYCWVLERIGSTGLLPRYHHFGHMFLRVDQALGNYYMVQEYIEGRAFDAERCTPMMVQRFLAQVEKIHATFNVALGDLEGSNLLIARGRQIRVVDCEFGREDKLNRDFLADYRALRGLFIASGEQKKLVREWIARQAHYKPRRRRNRAIGSTQSTSRAAATQ